jgi:hypothetical protein
MSARKDEQSKADSLTLKAWQTTYDSSRRPTVELERLPEREEVKAVELEAQNPCECPEATDALCVPCRARELANETIELYERRAQR